jgi:4,5:9,10-diseco-3-hydroxy-5,9,17-trioxoandrosta-1(10),2-diene-4-oate hydrolase
MPSRYRPSDGRIRRLAHAAAALLVLDALAHLLWAAGLTWPFGSIRDLSYALLGAELPFTAPVLLPLAALLLGAAAVVHYRAVLGRDHRAGPWLQLGILALTAAVSVRALAGLVWALDIGTPRTHSAFYWLNLLLYTPLCLLLAGALWLIARHGLNRRRAVRSRIAVVTPLPLAAVLLYGAYGWAPTAQEYHPAEMPGMAGVTSRYLDTEQARFHYTRQGDGPPVVLISPGATGVFAWQPQAEALAARHTVYVVDLPGQGFTELNGTGQDFVYDLPAMTGALGAFLDGAGLETVTLGGLSWSGGWALSYAQRHPERVDRLRLLASSGADRPDPLSWRLLLPPALGELLTNLGAADRGSAADMVRGMFVNQDRVTGELIDAMWRPSTFDGNRESLHLLQRGLDWTETEDAMPDVTQPTLLLWAKRTAPCPSPARRSSTN